MINRDNDYVFVEVVPVGYPNNPPDINGEGSVSYFYSIGKYEVTNDEYVLFLNSVGAADNVGLYNTNMGTDQRGGITRSGPFGAYNYSSRPDMGNKPVNWVSLHSAMRFCNWMHNGRPSGGIDPTTTEDGAYDMSTPAGNIIPRKSGAKWAVPTYNQQYKAAYHDPVNPGADAGGTPDYWYMPTMTDVNPPIKALANPVGDIPIRG